MKFSVNPAWPHFLGIFSLMLACLLGSSRMLLNHWSDPMHCHALLNRGSWLDSKHSNWQPDGCMLYSYGEKEASACLRGKEIIFIGDSVTRQLFFQLSHTLDSKLPSFLLDDAKKHSDHTFSTTYGTNLSFTWDPFLNSSYTKWLLTEARTNVVVRGNSSPAPAMLVLGSGLWYLRHANSSGGVNAWEKTMETILNTLSTHPKPADKVVLLPVGQIYPSKLSAARALTMHPRDIDAMNVDLYYRINPPSESLPIFRSSSTKKSEVSLPLVFNNMLDESLTEDGVHFSESLIKVQVNLLLNLRCNDVLSKSPPYNKSCCNRYPVPSLPHFVFLTMALLVGPFLSYNTFKSGFGNGSLSPLIISGALALIYVADRSDFWLKEQKQFNAWSFGALCASLLVVGLSTVKCGENDMGFLNRNQTDEWKGWMQIIILVYHYFGGSKVSGIYNPVRVLVASYLFMTGYGHTTFYLRKADFGFLRIAQVLIRLNFFTICLAFVMNTEYISYYFTPLVSMWYLVVYLTMVVGARFNDKTPLLLIKIMLSAGVMTWFLNESWLLEMLFDTIHRLFAIRWSPQEWAFRVNLDLWIVYVGMLTSVFVVKTREYRLTDNPRWPWIMKTSIGAAALILVWFFAFELYQESKFAYNSWHPYISFLPVLAFVVLRNASVILRSGFSRAFAFVGKCSLEAFIIQYHFWLAGDNKGVLLVVPGTRWRPLNIVVTGMTFLYLCDRVAYATGEITNAICATGTQEFSLPTTATSSTIAQAALSEAQGIEMPIPVVSHRVDDSARHETGNLLPIETATSTGWVDASEERTLETSSAGPLQRRVAGRSSFVSLNAKIFRFLALLWLFNVLWPDISDVATTDSPFNT
ncbi:hypothetical protein M413DRAFT_440005 [Hebeloma cylindrosporum]|uniref:Uncharacterized protein n=1 Tax=Hebeloma cylindrosporum TaxID=76867 RepID=A0A0C3CVW4_HEBCY|nr:hypothetical protein M413DRAFT_440005 [Hebeloma cylindrosporum h7]